ncbi:hypothetical protein BJY00DRAFT_91877 [Aspergillus carlsbadensis]|nr:hypothetical protein BJY00DRAFT_91877 [Aspergillus carlsbadensis]
MLKGLFSLSLQLFLPSHLPSFYLTKVSSLVLHGMTSCSTLPLEICILISSSLSPRDQLAFPHAIPQIAAIFPSRYLACKGRRENTVTDPSSNLQSRASSHKHLRL